MKRKKNVAMLLWSQASYMFVHSLLSIQTHETFQFQPGIELIKQTCFLFASSYFRFHYVCHCRGLDPMRTKNRLQRFYFHLSFDLSLLQFI